MSTITQARHMYKKQHCADTRTDTLLLAKNLHKAKETQVEKNINSLLGPFETEVQCELAMGIFFKGTRGRRFRSPVTTE